MRRGAQATWRCGIRIGRAWAQGGRARWLTARTAGDCGSRVPHTSGSRDESCGRRRIPKEKGRTRERWCAGKSRFCSRGEVPVVRRIYDKSWQAPETKGEAERVLLLRNPDEAGGPAGCAGVADWRAGGLLPLPSITAVHFCVTSVTNVSYVFRIWVSVSGGAISEVGGGLRSVYL